ncbi:MAG TPA: hypothetical protein VFS25_24670 [Chitinophaga sp.]|nr:hypothetical protein [Chitinophaga sp.]HEU4556064.1 hypothetical protein [Chitinophaga sp.]
MNAQKNGFGVIIAAAGMAAVQTPGGRQGRRPQRSYTGSTHTGAG